MRFAVKTQVARASAVVLVCLLTFTPSLATFTLDPTFAGGGRMTIGFPDSTTAYSSTARRVFVQPGGRIIIAGQFTQGTPDGQLSGVKILALQTNGAIESQIDSDWQSNGFTSLRDSLMYSDGRVLRLSQFFNTSGSSTVRVARYEANGAVDSVFGSNAIIGSGGGFGTARPAQISVRSDGKVLVLIKDNGDFNLYRLNPNGTRDTTFGSNGILTIRFNKLSSVSEGFLEMIVLPDGKILLIGNTPPTSFPNGSSEFFVGRLGESGNWDKTFGRVGFVSMSFGPGVTGLIEDAIVQPDGNILLCGNITDGDVDVWMMRLRPNGRVDTSFGNSGVVIRDFSPGATDRATALALSSDGKIRLVGMKGAPATFLVARFSANGTFEEHTSVDFTPDYSNAYDVALQADGKIVVVGDTKHPNPQASSGSVFAIARLTE